MNKIKINLDRKGISSKEILEKMDFDQLLDNHMILSKPFYKTKWFYGVTGLATVTLIVSSAYSINMEGDKIQSKQKLLSNIVPHVLMKDHQNMKNVLIEKEEKENIPIIEQKQIKPIEKTNTFENLKTKESTSKKEITLEVKIKKEESVDENKKVFNMLDLYPRISGKLNGSITKEELFNDEGLKTNTEIEIISFELHLVDGVGGKVFSNKGNTLNTEMKTALTKVSSGGEIYFEEINGQAPTGEILRLSPLRYVLLN